MTQFEKDLARGKRGEKRSLAMLRQVFSEQYEFIDVSNNVFDYHNGDIAIRSKATGVVKYIDIKDDNWTYQTGNIALELWQQFEGKPLRDGWITSNYDFLGVYMYQCDTLLILDFKRLVEYYNNTDKVFRTRQVNDGQSISCIALIPIQDVVAANAFIAAIGDYPEWIDEKLGKN